MADDALMGDQGALSHLILSYGPNIVSLRSSLFPLIAIGELLEGYRT